MRVCVTGKSGSSKSLLMQELVAGLIGAGGEAVVIDDGWSFQHMGSEGDDDALDQAAPLADWELPEAFLILRRLMEARMGKKGKREFVQVLRLLEIFQIADVEAGIQSALERGTIGFDAVKHLVLCRIERRPSRLDMTVYPYLPKAHVAVTSPGDYMALLSGDR